VEVSQRIDLAAWPPQGMRGQKQSARQRNPYGRQRRSGNTRKSTSGCARRMYQRYNSMLQMR
jgi:hypothetical protein